MGIGTDRPRVAARTNGIRLGLGLGLGLVLGLALILGVLGPVAGRVPPPGPPVNREAPVGSQAPVSKAPVSSEALSWQDPSARPGDYPLERHPDPLHYLPHAPWIGRLILPSAAEATQEPGDWVWIAIEQAPGDHRELIGQRLRLHWKQEPRLQALVRRVTVDVHLGTAAHRAEAAGNVVPTRLDGRLAVGPLQSLAGARPHDTVTVELEDCRIDPDGALAIGRPPVQISGRWMALVQVLGPDPGAGDRLLVRHWERSQGGFSGPSESVRIPRLPPDAQGRRLFDPQGLEHSPAGQDGWYLYGAPAADGVFTVQALAPRRLLRLQPDQRLQGTAAGLRHLNMQNWAQTPQRRGQISRVEINPDGSPQRWRLGDRALLIHTFGGIGGVAGEAISGFTVTGHFAFGQALVSADPFTGEPLFSLRYHQIYANNPNGIVAGTQDWSAFSGNLQRGWLGLRPISDVLVRVEEPLLKELALQAEVLMARYRSGDGTGVALVTPATSCVQDSSQALYIALQELRQQRAEGQLGSLDLALTRLLAPYGTVRADWQRNASLMAATPTAIQGHAFQRGQSVSDVLLSWRSMLPRRGHDGMAAVFLRHGSPLWILRTNQVPGRDPRLEPLAPTLLFGQLPLVSTAVARLVNALFTLPDGDSGRWTLLLLGGYAAVVVPLGVRSGLLRWRPERVPLLLGLRRGLSMLWMPAFVEELVFRGLVLPQPHTGVEPTTALLWGSLSVGLFLLYHPLASRLWYPVARRLFHDPRFLGPCALLGITCVVAYDISGSLWCPVALHWIVVVVWLELLGGRPLVTPLTGSARQQPAPSQPQRSKTPVARPTNRTPPT